MAYSAKDIARANAKQNARLATWKQEADAYASSKGVALPGNFVDLALNQGRDVDYSGRTKNTLSFVDSYIQDKNAFHNNAIKNKTYEYVRLMYGVDASAADRPGTSQNARKLELESFIKSAALSGVPISSIQSSIDTGQKQFGSYVQDDKLTQLFTKVAIPIALSFALPGMGSAIGAQLTAAGLTVSTATATAIGTAMASTAIQMAQGVDFETALKNATVNAVIQTGAPSVATEINKLVKIPQISDAITSAGASVLKTAAAGGSAADIERNMIGAIAGSATSSAVEYGTDGNISAGRLAGATVGGAVTGGTEGALIGLSGEYAGQKAAEEARLKESRSKMLASADTGTVSDSGTLGDVVVTSPKETPGITDTSIITPTGPISDREVMGAMQPSVPKPAPSPPSLREVEVKAKRELGETSILSPDPSLSTVTVKGEREIDSLPGVTVKGEREVDDTLSEVTVKGKQEEEPQVPEEKEPTEEKGKPYRPNLFVYGGTKPSTLSQTLGTTVEKVPTPSTTTGTSVGLGGRGEVESKESGKKRQTVWNEESLRLKDALGL